MARPELLSPVTLLVAAIVGCAAPVFREAPLPAPGPVPTAASVAPVPSDAGAAPSPLQTTAAPSKPALLHVVARREVDAPVFAIAVDKAPHLAALSTRDVWIHDANGYRRERLPAVARRDEATDRVANASSTGIDLGVFFGRDYKPRIIGTRADGLPPTSVTLRLLPEGIRSAAGEIGRLAAPGGLVAVLGTDDPEIVCRPGDQCVVKRRSGWTYLPAPTDITKVAVAAGQGWAVAGKRLLRLGDTWQDAGAPGTWERADALFALADRAWVVDRGRSAIHAFDGATWVVTPSPVAGPRALWGTAPNALWLAGDAGLARLDDSGWHLCDAPEGPLEAVMGRGAGELWTGGAHGLYSVEIAP